MTNDNKVPATAVAQKEAGSENGKDLSQLPDANGTFNRRFSVTDLWSIRRNGRKFKIHHRISRLR